MALNLIENTTDKWTQIYAAEDAQKKEAKPQTWK